MNCPSCNSKMVCKVGKHLYKESGLNNVVLRGIEIGKCSCGEKVVFIPAIPSLHKLIGAELINKKSLLNGNEIRFLRKNMSLTAKKLSGYLGVDNATISRWENGKQPIAKSNDLLLRLVYSVVKDLSFEETKHLVEENFKNVKPQQKKMPKRTISLDKWLNQDNVCQPA